MIFPKTQFKDKNGNPLTIMEWEKLFVDISYRRINLTDLGTHRISTVWMGHPTNLMTNDGYFETMVFPNDEENIWNDTEVNRYDTIAEAIHGHEMMVKKWTEKLKDNKNESI